MLTIETKTLEISEKLKRKVEMVCRFTNTKATSNPNDRIPDLRRCERLKWNREIIENNNCVGCKKKLYYEQYYKNNVRINLLFPDVRFKVILEKRDKYY